MTDEPLEVVRGHLDAFNARDLDRVLAGFDDDAVFASGDQMVVGARAIRVLFADAFAAPVNAELELRDAVTQGQVVACEMTERLAFAGGQHEVDVAAFYTVRRGRLARVRIYRDLGDQQPPG